MILVPCNIIYFALRKIDWQFTTSDTRIKLTLLYPKLLLLRGTGNLRSALKKQLF